MSIIPSAHTQTLTNSSRLGMPLRGGNPRAFNSEWIILRTGGQTWYNYFIPPTLV